MYDIIIVGGGIAGMTAALYAQRNEKSVLIIEAETVGGQIANSPKVENYPTIDSISGSDLANRVFEQVVGRGADFELAGVRAVDKIADKHFAVRTEYGDYEGRSVILATGVKHRKLGLDREDELVGHGVSYCAVCDGPFFKGEEVALVGSGNSALQYALLLAGYCQKVHMLVITPDFTGDEALVREVKNTPNITVRFNTACTAFVGQDELTAVDIRGEQGNERLAVKGIFVAIGQVPDNARYAHLADLDDYGYFAADERCVTKTPGVFVAGDCRTKAVRQLTTAACDGAVAALAACRYLG